MSPRLLGAARDQLMRAAPLPPSIRLLHTPTATPIPGHHHAPTGATDIKN